MGDRLSSGREHFTRRAWADAFDAFATVDVEELDPGDAERLAVAAHLTGRDAESAAAWGAAYRGHRRTGNDADAVRCAFWLGLGLMLAGQMAQAGGWFGRAGRMVEDEVGVCAGAGYLMIPRALGALEEGDAERARDLAIEAVEIGRRFDEPDLTAFATLGLGQALIAKREIPEGTARLDEVMVAVTAGEVGPITAGIVYCAVILECMQLFDLRRASEWTDALEAWCDQQPDLVLYRGQCLVHRSQVEQAAGRWDNAKSVAESACRRLEDPPHPALGLARYQAAELSRLRGDFDVAEQWYTSALRSGHSPVPGRALLELARGRVDIAAAVINRALTETVDALARPPLLAAAVVIFRAEGRHEHARAAAGELDAIAAEVGSPVLRAAADQGLGATALDDDPPAALRHLRAAADAWRNLHMPYELARTAVLIAEACGAAGDRVSAELELAGARETFAALGARADLDAMNAAASAARGARSAPGSLSPREQEVLRHVAAGRTNREISAALVISRHTVSRHLENIFTKLGVTTRAAATAHAYEHGLL